ncbi:mesoderm-specific transcript homolog protein-like [Xenia sp. Carnegie-2017]|uniref:mesoderm-specific transcript homolog protein-like n=1 Tax=Xenia sp. Carnegie-2017 TaxID=2897299 RepID=UPI001F0419DA|nr:mesoderm-specific transcript homolog protein-like [Xenia sp. Carnegie-2017]
MALLFAIFKRIFLVGSAVFIGVYLNFPPPNMSHNLRLWMQSGQFFLHAVNGKAVKIFYKDVSGYGHKNKILLLIHGFPTSSFDWNKVWEPLREKFGRVLTADMAGFGFSDKPKDINYTVNLQADMFENFLKSNDVKEVNIIAHDLGLTVALELLARYEDRRKKKSTQEGVDILSICLTNGGLFPQNYFPRPIQQLLLLPWIGPLVTRVGNRFIFAKSFSEVFGPKTQPQQEELNDHFIGIRYADGNLLHPNILGYIRERQVYKERWVGSLQKTFLPIHFIYGPADPVNPPIFVTTFKKIVPQHGITVLDAHIGHYPQLEDPENFMLTYNRFLNSF